MPIIRVPELIVININVNFGKLVIEHRDSNTVDQATLDKMDAALSMNNEGIKEAQIDEVK